MDGRAEPAQRRTGDEGPWCRKREGERERETALAQTLACNAALESSTSSRGASDDTVLETILMLD